MTTQSKLKLANHVCTGLLVASVVVGIVGHFIKSSGCWVAAKALVGAGLVAWYICYRLQARLALEKRRNRTESGLPLR
jgi:hypothetical protein